MPYTPPSQQSPIASRPETPLLSRSQSYVKGQQQPSATPGSPPRPGLPRSSSSTSYLHRQRRSPSVPKSTSFAGAPSTPDATPRNADFSEADGPKKSTTSGSLRQSPSPLNDLQMPTGAVISPPDSSTNSSDDETNLKRGRVRELENLAELQAAIRIIEQHRESSPNRAREETRKARLALGLIVPDADSSARGLIQQLSPGLPLSKEARKISHSRSATDSAAQFHPSRQTADSPGRSRSVSESEAEEFEDGELQRKPSMVRKKSGELVRPALRPSYARRRPSSMPGTPTYSKAVHFDSHLEHVRHFLQVDRPLAVSAGSSPVECYDGEMEFPFGGNENVRSPSPPFQWEIRLSNFPRETVGRKDMPIRVDKVFLSADNKHLIGSVAVANLSFHKLVVARFTLDYWKTTSEVVAEYVNDVRRKGCEDGLDRFEFSIKLEDQANLEEKTLFFCVRYNVNGQEFWDSNNNINYQVDFAKKAMPQNGKQGIQGAGARPLTALPRSKPSPPNSSGRPRSMHASFDDFADGLESHYDFSAFQQPAAKVVGDQPLRFRNTKSRGKIVPDAPGRRNNAAGQAFGNRYDFGASLSAAIQAAGTTVGDRGGPQFKDDVKLAPAKQTSFSQKPANHSGPTATAPSASPDNLSARANKPVVEPSATKPLVVKDSAKPLALTSEKPSLQSSSYHELLDKYCFFGSAKASPTFQKPGNGQTDGPAEDGSGLGNAIGAQFGSASPAPPRDVSPPADENRSSKVTSPCVSRSPSPATGSGFGSRTASPVSFGYPYHQSLQSGMFAETCAPTAIRG